MKINLKTFKCVECGKNFEIRHCKEAICNDCLLKKWLKSKGQERGVIYNKLRSRGITAPDRMCKKCGDEVAEKQKICDNCLFELYAFGETRYIRSKSRESLISRGFSADEVDENRDRMMEYVKYQEEKYG